MIGFISKWLGYAFIAFGAVMFGIYEILIKADMQNVPQMKAKKDIGN